jgi:predicted deacylase
VVNPDGFTATRRYDGPADPNRSYPYPERETATPTPSIAGVIRFFSTHDVKASIDFHAYGELIMYPWAYTHTLVEPAAHSRFDALTAKMAESNRYTYGPISDVIYVAPGSSADYYFWKKGSLSLGIEVGREKVPSPSEFPDYFTSQEESTWRFLEGI